MNSQSTNHLDATDLRILEELQTDASLSNVELARTYADAMALRSHPAIARFLGWIADKPADFHAPTLSAGRRRR